MIENKAVDERGGLEIPEARRCLYLLPNGQRCRGRRWGKELCFGHDPEAAELRKNPGRPVSAIRVMTATEIQELLAETLLRLQTGKLPARQAYATGYLCQLMLGNLKAVGKEYEEARSYLDREGEMLWRVRALDEGRCGGFPPAAETPETEVAEAEPAGEAEPEEERENDEEKLAGRD